MNRPVFRIAAGIALAALAAASSGCASLSKDECLNANWEDIGVRDGAYGRPEEYLIQHSTACARVNVVPDRGAWLHGHARGLERFCVPQRAYQIGESGQNFDAGICRNFDVDRLHTAWQKGLDVNRMSVELAAIDAEIRDINTALENKDLENKERERLAFRLGVLVTQRGEAARAYEDARWRARDL